MLSLSGVRSTSATHGQRSYNQQLGYWDRDYAASLFEGSSDLYQHMIRHNQGSIDDNEFYTGLAAFGLDSAGVQQYYKNFADTTGAENRGRRYNEHWGWDTNDAGKKVLKNERRNYYHKPQITLKDFWKINKKLSWSNIAYVSIGRGGGERYFGSSSTILRDAEGQVDWDAIEYNNQWKTLFGTVYSTADAAYDPDLLKSSQIMSSSVNNHTWIGGLSQFNYMPNERWTVAGGADYRWYKGEHYVEITDLLGGDYFVDNNNFNAETPMKVVGDKIAKQPYNNHRDGYVQWAWRIRSSRIFSRKMDSLFKPIGSRKMVIVELIISRRKYGSRR